MKRIFQVLIPLFCLLLALGAVLPMTVAAKTEYTAEDVLTYDGLAARLTDKSGVRSLWSVNTQAVAALEAEGYTVAYGAIMGISSYDGDDYLTAEALLIDGSAAAGYTATAKGASAVCVYVTGGAAYASGRYLDADKTQFAYTTIYNEETGAKLKAELVYRGFTVLIKDGVENVTYTEATGELFGGENASYGPATSMAELADYFVNGYTATSVRGYRYNQNEVLRRVLTATGGEIRTLSNPITLKSFTTQPALAQPITTEYLTAARAAYKTDAYADYTTSIIGNYTTSSSNYYDRPREMVLSFSAVSETDVSYTLMLSRSEDFSENVKTYELGTATTLRVTNLFTDTTYYYRVTARLSDGAAVTSATVSFTTARDVVRWIYVDGVRNVRDIGGWTGLNQGMVFRGSELNLVSSHGLQITDAGLAVMRNELGIKTDLDFRASTENGVYGTSSPLGEGVAWVNRPIGNFLSAFTPSYGNVLKLFADPDNYPFYMHCWGGADRTGTVAMMLEGICGVKEEDLAIDLELTSFASFGYRYRYDNGNYLYASTIAKIKSDFTGDTLQEKFINYGLSVGLSRAEISNIRSLLSGTGVTFDTASLSDLVFNGQASENLIIALRTPNGQTVADVTVGGVMVDYTFAGGTLTVTGQELLSKGALGGKICILMSDGQTLTTYAEEALALQISGGDYSKLFNEGAVTVKGNTLVKSQGALSFSHKALKALYDAGYTSVSFRVSADMTGSVSASDARIRLIARWYGTDYITNSDKQDITLSSVPGVATGFLTIHLSEEFLGESNYFILSPQTGENIVLKNFVLCKAGQTPTEPIDLVGEIESGNLSYLFHSAVTEENNTFHSTNKIQLSHDALAALYNAGYTSISFRVTATEMTNEQRVVIRWCTSLTSDSYLSGGPKHDVYAKSDDTPDDLTTVNAFVTVPLNATVLADSNFLQISPQFSTDLTLSNIMLAKNGEIPTEPSEPDEPEEPAEKTTVERIVAGEWDLLVNNPASNFTFSDGTIVKNVGVIELKFSNAVLEELRAAGYTKLTFTMSAEDAALARIVCRWKNSGGSWQSSPNKNDLSPATNGQTKTVTFDLTEATSGAGWYIAFQVQKTGNSAHGDNTLTLTNFSLS